MNFISFFFCLLKRLIKYVKIYMVIAMLYTSIDNKKIKEIKKLNQKKYRDKENKFLIEGEHLVLEAYKAGVLDTLILEESINNASKDVETIFVSYEVLKYISELDTPQKVMGICKKSKENEIGNRVLILDQIQDPGNLGTIIRSSVAFSIDTIILSNDSVDLYNSKVIRASQGMLFNINIIRCELEKTIYNLRKNNYKIYGTSVIDGKDVKKLEKNNKFAIIMGNEGSGLSYSLKNLCDEFIYIKMNKACESLNVGVATSIILYELSK